MIWLLPTSLHLMSLTPSFHSNPTWAFHQCLEHTELFSTTCCSLHLECSLLLSIELSLLTICSQLNFHCSARPVLPIVKWLLPLLSHISFLFVFFLILTIAFPQFVYLFCICFLHQNIGSMNTKLVFLCCSSFYYQHLMQGLSHRRCIINICGINTWLPFTLQLNSICPVAYATVNLNPSPPWFWKIISEGGLDSGQVDVSICITCWLLKYQLWITSWSL